MITFADVITESPRVANPTPPVNNSGLGTIRSSLFRIHRTSKNLIGKLPEWLIAGLAVATPMKHRAVYTCLFAAYAVISANVIAEEFTASMLTDDEQSVIDSIQQTQVLETVSFLASDDMNGRDTPSKEFVIAAEYVANRFRKAGLEGLGTEGGFFQTVELFRTSAPATKAIASTAAKREIQLTVFTGLKEVLDVQGAIREVTETPDPDGNKSEIFIMDEQSLAPQTRDNPLAALVKYLRATAPLVRQGAKVVLLRVADDSPLFDVVESFQQQPISIPAQFEPQCAIVLVAKSQELSGDIQLEIPPNVKAGSPVHNVVGVLRGSDPNQANKAVMISAHLDHIGPAPRGEDKVNNGADDNASGVTGVLTLADAFAALKTRPERSVIFITFWGEEKGLLGSKYFAENPLWKLEDLICDVNLEMLGRPEENADGKAWGTGWPHSNLGPLMATGAKRAGVTIFHHEQFSEMLYARSDNASFLSQGVIAHSFSAGSLHSDYHQPSDEVSKLNIPHMTKVIQGLMAGVLPIARGQATPVKTAQK